MTFFIGSWSSDPVPIPMPVSPSQYLQFAELDLNDESLRGAVNALSNAKRAIDSRIECLLAGFCLLKVAKKEHWNVPKKIDRISDLGVIAHRILKKINKRRNLIEHEFVAPSRDEVEDFVDVISLFHEATRPYLENVPTQCEVQSDTSGNWFRMKIDFTESRITFGSDDAELKPTDATYREFISLWAKLIASVR